MIIFIIIGFYFIKKTTQRNKGLNSSTDVANEVNRVFDTKISSGYVRKIRRQYSMFYIIL